MTKKKYLVTSALIYANGPLHIGHLLEYIQTDIFVRFLRLIGEDVIYVCADDMHGTPIQVNAEKQGMKPEDFAMRFHQEHKEDFSKFLISFDSYSHTNTHINEKFTNLFFETLRKKGYIYTKPIFVMYCPQCKRFLPDRFVKGICPKCGAPEQYGDMCEKCGSTYNVFELKEPRCAICGAKPEKRESEHFFFRLSAFSDKLKDWLLQNKELQPEIVNYVKNWIKESLKDWCISRDKPYFGFKIPNAKDKFFYVWFDAPIGYISATEEFCKKTGLDVFKDYWKNDKCEIIHFIGKDIVYFHFLFWPAMLMGAEFNLPKAIYVHGMVTVEKEKMSKSRGTFILAREFIERFKEPEFLRFYYASMLSKKLGDVDFSEDEFKHFINAELIGDIANFCYRVLSFLNKNFASTIGSFSEDHHVITECKKEFNKIKEYYKELNFRDAVKHILKVASLGNAYFQKEEPWKIVKKDVCKAHEAASICANIVKNLAILLQPILPRFSAELEKQLNLSGLKWNDLGFELKEHVIGKAEIILKKIE